MVKPIPRGILTRLGGIGLRELLRGLGALGIVGAVIGLAIAFRDVLWAVRAVTYPGIFLLSLAGSSSIFVPIPGLASVCAGAGVLGLNIGVVAALAALGEALGETTGYLAGVSGRFLLEKHRYYPRLYAWMRYRGGLVLFLASSIPNPLFDLVGILAGSLGYPLHLFYPVVFAGKLLKDLTIAFLCSLGLTPLFGE
jgi:membrane protein YqaA with SNARE-associated domain